MDLMDIANAVEDSYPEDKELMLAVVAIHTINLTLKPNIKDMTVKDRFAQRILKKGKKALWCLSDEKFQLAYDLSVSCLYQYDIQLSLGGIGGAEPKTLKEIYQDFIKKL